MDQQQKEVFAFLAAPATHGGAAVRQIDTHISAVFLAGNQAFKIKRAVRFPYLDFSSLQQRHAACAAELEINRRFAPQIYRRIVPITRATDGGLAIDGSGTAVEWAVLMTRFDDTATLDRLADAGGINPALADALARCVAAAHRAAPMMDAAPWIAALPTYLDRNQQVFADTPEIFPADQAATLYRLSQERLLRLHPLLRARGKHHFIRQGHGDLHLGNIALIENQPVLFDAIEFDPIIATGDVLYDLAFLLMDLAERGLMQAANIVLNRYLPASGHDDNLDGLAALPFYLSLRAAIRANVMAARLPILPAAERAAIAASARKYFDFAGALIMPQSPMLVAIGGLSGTGKSVLAGTLAPDIPPVPGAIWLRSDSERKYLFGVGDTEPLGAEAYRPEITASVYATLAEKAQRCLAAGHSVIADAVFARTEERALIEKAAAGKRFQGLFLTADLPTRLTRVGLRANDASDANCDVAARQEAYDVGRLDWPIIDAAGSAAETLAAGGILLLPCRQQHGRTG
jgi:aminoglycoside phosphotransferase family enzyme/predicted kinase